MGHPDDEASALFGSIKIDIHLVYNIKHNGRNHGRVVAVGHKTLIPTDLVYAGDVSLRRIK